MMDSDKKFRLSSGYKARVSSYETMRSLEAAGYRFELDPFAGVVVDPPLPVDCYGFAPELKADLEALLSERETKH